MKRSGKSVIMTSGMWVSDFNARTAKGKKPAKVKAEAKVAARAFRHNKTWANEF